MKTILYTKLKHVMLLTTFFMSSVVFGQWTVYDASLTPIEDPIEFGISNRQGWADEDFIAAWTVLDDVAIDGNKYVNFLDDNVDNQGAYRIVWAAEEAPSQLTLVARLRNKDVENIVKGFNVDIDFNLNREEIMIYNDNTFRLRRGSDRLPEAGSQYQPLPEGFDVLEWNIYRFVCDFQGGSPSFKVYVNEQETPFASSVPIVGGANNRHFRFGNNERAALTAFDLDWMIWDTSGAYAPGEGTAIPAELLGEVEYSPFGLYNGNDLPMEHPVITFQGSNLNTGTASSTNPEIVLTEEIFDGWWTVLPDDDIVGNNFVRFEDSDIAWRGMYRIQFPEDNIPETLTLLARMRAVDFENAIKTFDIDFDFNGAREQVMIHNHTVITDGVGDGESRLRLRRGSPAGYHTFPEAFDLSDWHIFRFVMDTRIDIAENIFPTFKVYVDETLLFAENMAASGNVNNRQFRFGNSEQANITKFDLDWLYWDATGAYAPGEGNSLPEGISMETGPGIISSINTPNKSTLNANAVGVDYINMTGINMGKDWDRLPLGIYIVVTTYDNGMVTKEKVLKSR